MTWDTELDMMLATAKGSVRLQLGVSEARGILDEAEQLSQEGRGPGMIGVVRSVQVRTGALPGLATGVTLLVDGVARKVRRRAMIDDGALTLIELENP